MARPTMFDEAMSGAERQRRYRERHRKRLAKERRTARKAAKPNAKALARQKREAEWAGRVLALPDRRYGILFADPGWRYEPWSRQTGMDRAADNHYFCPPLDEIMRLDVQSISAKDAVLFLCATAPMLPDALTVMTAWGFAYKTHAIWVKQRPGNGRGTGYWFTGEHELLLVGTRGKVVPPAMGTQARSVFTAPVGRHSEKPEVFYEMIERHWPNTPKIELNRRGPPRPGWDAWGFEAEPTAA